MEITYFDFFVNREKGKPCLVAGNAPTIRNFPFEDFKGVYILCGSAPQTLEKAIPFYYWVNANSVFPIPKKHKNEINAIGDSIFIFADSVAYSGENIYDHNFLEKNLNVRWFAYDQRHFNHKKCQPLLDCCKLVDLYPRRITLQEFIQQHFGMDSHYSSGSTVAIHSLAFAILMGCSPIYLQGIELPLYAKDYYHSNKLSIYNLREFYNSRMAHLREWINGKPVLSPFSTDIPQILADFEYLVNLCHKIGIEIYNLSPTSTVNQIKDLPYLDHRQINTTEYFEINQKNSNL